MRRRQLFEFGDQPWLPTVLRDLQTDFLQQMNEVLRIYEPAVPLIDRLLARAATRRIVEFCSGGAGPWERLLAKGWEVTVTLTDLYPHVAAFTRARNRFPQHLAFCPDPVDARRPPAELAGVRILFNSFHHFQPADARAILQEAVARRAAIGIFEIAERTPRTVCSMLFGVPLLVFALTPRIRPWRWSRLFWTYCIPLAPAVILWDGLVSLLRAYSPAELDALAAAAGGDYHWERSRLVPPFPGVPLTCLLGYPPPHP